VLLVAACEAPALSEGAPEAAERAGATSARIEPLERPAGEPVVVEADATDAASPATRAPASPPRSFLVPSGTLLHARTNSAVDSTQAVPGHRVTATLLGDVTVAGTVVLPAGTLVYARLARTGDGAAALLELQPTDVLVGGRLHPMHAIDLAVPEPASSTATDLRRPKLDVAPDTPAQVTLSGEKVTVPAGTVLQFRLERTLELRY
jgi:hypothetical protein